MGGGKCTEAVVALEGRRVFLDCQPPDVFVGSAVVSPVAPLVPACERRMCPRLVSTSSSFLLVSRRMW